MFNHMVNGGIECDAVTCCSLITALDKGGQWQLAEQVGLGGGEEGRQSEERAVAAGRAGVCVGGGGRGVG